MEIPALIFDKLWRSRYATEKYMKSVLLEKINFSEKRVLDFGCGVGSYCLLFDSDKYLGIDIDDKRIAYAQKHYPQYKFQKIDIKYLREKFDYIFIVSTLHHLNNATGREYIRHLFKILDSNGAIVGMEPCLFPNTCLNNWFMKFIDKGKFIRTEKDYMSLFNGFFQFKVQKKYNRHFLYNELFYIAYKNF